MRQRYQRVFVAVNDERGTVTLSALRGAPCCTDCGQLSADAMVDKMPGHIVRRFVRAHEFRRPDSVILATNAPSKRFLQLRQPDLVVQA